MFDHDFDHDNGEMVDTTYTQSKGYISEPDLCRALADSEAGRYDCPGEMWSRAYYEGMGWSRAPKMRSCIACYKLSPQ